MLPVEEINSDQGSFSQSLLFFSMDISLPRSRLSIELTSPWIEFSTLPKSSIFSSFTLPVTFERPLIYSLNFLIYSFSGHPTPFDVIEVRRLLSPTLDHSASEHGILVGGGCIFSLAARATANEKALS